MSTHRNHRCGPNGRHGGKGVIYRVTKGLADRFDLKRKWVLAGFIVGLIINAPVTLFLFLLAWFWVDHPGKFDHWWGQAREFWTGATSKPSMAGGYSASDAGFEDDRAFEADPFIKDLKRKFSDLEKRAGKMEEHVSSEEYELRREFKKMKD